MFMAEPTKILSVIVYIPPNERVNDIIKFLHFVFLPMILEGDFNTNFSSDKAGVLKLFCIPI